MPINIHGKEYITVAERVKEIHKDEKDTFSIVTEVVETNPVVIKATVVCKKGTFTGISAANPLKAIEKMSPYEVAETSAVGRALGFAGYGLVDDIATADEMVKAGADDDLVITEDMLNQPVKDSTGRTYCSKCGAHASKKVADFSLSKYKKILCMNCQKKEDEDNDGLPERRFL